MHHELSEVFGFFVGGHEGAGAYFNIEDEGIEVFGELLAHDTGGDEERRFYCASVIAESVENAVGGDDAWGLADESCSALFESVEELSEIELGVEAGDGFELVECASGVAEGTARDHGDADAGDAVRCG